MCDRPLDPDIDEDAYLDDLDDDWEDDDPDGNWDDDQDELDDDRTTTGKMR